MSFAIKIQRFNTKLIKKNQFIISDFAKIRAAKASPPWQIPSEKEMNASLTQRIGELKMLLKKGIPI